MLKRTLLTRTSALKSNLCSNSYSAILGGCMPSRILSISPQQEQPTIEQHVQHAGIYHSNYGRDKLDQKVSPVYRICLTGGPCAGKTTALTKIVNDLNKYGFKTYIVPEAATLLMKSGAMIDNSKMTDGQSLNFQVQLMRTQIALEDNLYNIAKNMGIPSVLICDRGLMDTIGYIGHDEWRNILEKTGWTNIELRDNRYDAVIHMVTAAIDAEEYYDHDNEARYETVEEAAERDNQLRTAYIGHNQLFIIGNKHQDGFKGKMRETLNVVKSLLGLPTSKTGFKKLLVESRNMPYQHHSDAQEMNIDYHFRLFQDTGIQPYNLEGKQDQDFYYSINKITQTYLKAEDNGISFVRKKSGARLLDTSESNHGTQFEFERRYEQGNQILQKKRLITGREYTDLVLDANLDQNMSKVDILRTSFLYEGKYFQMETCTNIPGGPTFLRLENHDNESIQLPPYVKIVKDVSKDRAYTTKMIAKPDYRMQW